MEAKWDIGGMAIDSQLILREEGSFCLFRKLLYFLPFLLLESPIYFPSWSSSVCGLSPDAQDSLIPGQGLISSRSTRYCGCIPALSAQEQTYLSHDPFPQGLHSVRVSGLSDRLSEGRLGRFKSRFHHTLALHSWVS